MGSQSDCLLGQFERTLWISDSEAGLKVEKSGGVVEGEGECVGGTVNTACLVLSSPANDLTAVPASPADDADINDIS